VNTAKIKKMTIGLGSRGATAASGKGILYVDDVQLIKSKK